MMAVALEGAKRWCVDDDVRLATLCAKGDSRAFQVLYERHYNRVYTLARGVLLDHDEALDATQEVFLTLYKNIGRFDGRSQFSTWLYRVALNRCIQQGRKLRPRRLLEVGLDSQTLGTQMENWDSEPDAGVDRALARLDPNDRAVLVLFYWEEQSLKEIGEALGCKANAAKTRLFRARERFKALLESEGP
jgi:RNA polymerase sigma-70 factor (ECF subfamily)